MPKKARTILIVDDHPMMREGLSLRISSQPDLSVCGEAADMRQALEQVKTASPDLAIIDLSLTDGHGVDLIKKIKVCDRHVKMLVVSAYDEFLYAERCLRAGADGYVNKRECQEKILDAIRAVLDGQRYVSASMTQRLLGQAIGQREEASLEPADLLSDRELEVFRLIGQGVKTGAIAKRLHLSVHTIESHREKIRAKLGLKNGVELMRRAVQWVLENG